MTTNRVVSGIRPTGNVHLGNYLGAMQSAVALQEQFDSFYFIADLHAITDAQNASALGEHTLNTAALYLACGIDPARSTLFVQSHVPAHAELARLIGSITPFGMLRRMVQFREKSERRGEETSLGLLDYPVLMSADILLYQAQLVPVGDDQKQHLELTRDLAGIFNRIYPGKDAPVFTIPKPMMVSAGARVMSLTDGTSKMSKSDPSDQSRINLLDDPAVITRKIKRAKTDSILGLEFGNEARPEAHNLLTIYQIVSGKSRDEVATECATMGFGQFKKLLAEALVAHLEPIQKRYAEIVKDPATLRQVLRTGREKAQSVAETTLSRAKSAMGFVPAD